MRGTKCDECSLRGIVRIIRRINLEGKPWLCDACFRRRVAEEIRERVEREAREKG